MRAADMVITTNDSHAAIARLRGGKSADDVVVVRSGPSLNRFKLLPPDPSLRAGKKHLLVYLGEICKQDGVDFMVRAVKLLTETHGRRDFHVLFVGGGPYQPIIKAYAEEQGIMERRRALPHPFLRDTRYRSRSKKPVV
jgi:glycosyltransferase involved in cell wall biosynthesis